MYFVNKIIRKLVPRSLPAPSPMQRALIDRLRAQIRALPELVPEQAPTRAERFWLENRASIRRTLLSNDPRMFFDFPEIRDTMFVDHPPYIAQELKALRSRADWRQRWRPAIRESKTIPVPRCPYLCESSGNLIHQATHLRLFEQITELDVSRFDAILEFGGGYGGMCRLVHNLGFHGQYFIFDVPEFGALQKFYLRANDIPFSTWSEGAPGAICISEFSQLEHLSRNTPVDLFLAAWSLSETAFDFRRRVLGVARARHWLIAYQHEFESLDNMKFFSDWCRQNHAWHWQCVTPEYLPGQNSYLIGSPHKAS